MHQGAGVHKREGAASGGPGFVLDECFGSAEPFPLREPVIPELPAGPIPDLARDQGRARIHNAADLSECAKRIEQPVMIEPFDETDLGRDRGGSRPHRIKRCGERVYD
jgi:hypothetical protein